MASDFSDSIAHPRLLDFRKVAAADLQYDRNRLEAPTRTVDQTQADQEFSLRRAAEMEAGRAQNFYTIV
jgi:hypothetical protein